MLSTLYADDIVLYCYASNIKDLENALNQDLSITALWLNRKKLTLNIENTKSMLIGSDRKLLAANAISISIFDKEVEGVGRFKYLGVTLSSNSTGRSILNMFPPTEDKSTLRAFKEN